MMHGDSLSMYSLPNWLRLKFRDEIPIEWKPLLYEFVAFLDVLCRNRPPLAGILKTGTHEGKLLLRFRCRPALGDRDLEVLRVIGMRLSQLSAHRASMSQQSSATASPWGPRVHGDAAERGRDFDFDKLFGDRLAENFRPVRVDIFDWGHALDNIENVAAGRDADCARRTGNALARLVSSGHTRPLARPEENWSTRLDRLEQEMPNFAAVIRAVIRPHVAMSAKGIRHRMPPVLLIGPAGIGKTRFSQSLADILSVPPPLFLNLAAETNGSSLAGSSTFWSNSSPGKLFEVLAYGNRGHRAVGNPLVILDEIDKASTTHYDATGPLYSLLEEDTARRFQDQSLPDLQFDASHVRIVATANALNMISEPLRSRTMIFQIAAPSDEQLASIVRRIYEGLITRMHVALSTVLPESIIRQAILLSPRSAKSRLESCIGQALLLGRSEVQDEDWDAVSSDQQALARRSIGFLAG